MADNQTFLFESYQPDGSNWKIRYIGEAVYGVDTTEDRWKIFRLSHDPTILKITRIDVLPNVAWDNRGTLPWP